MSGAGNFGLGYKALRALAQSQDAQKWHHSKLVEEMFKPGEVQAFKWMQEFVLKHHKVPSLELLASNFPDIGNFNTPDPASYYLEHLENRLYYEKIDAANIKSQQILKENPAAIKDAEAELHSALTFIKSHRYRTKIINVVKEAPALVMKAYHDVLLAENLGIFGWPYLDTSSGGLMPGDVVTIVGRPAAGKTWLVLYSAMKNWLKGRRVLVISMEMAPLPICQRLVSMYTHFSIQQVKMGGISSKAFPSFTSGLVDLASQNDGFYVVDGNLAADPEDVYLLADWLDVDAVYIDGAYLMRNKNKKLDRFSRVAENAEAIKQNTSDSGKPTIASYQFARTASKKAKEKNGGVAGLEDIGYSDAIGQISTVSLALDQEESVETLNQRIVRVMKGRNGEIGQFPINWKFDVMNFDEVSKQESADGQDAQFEEASL